MNVLRIQINVVANLTASLSFLMVFKHCDTARGISVIHLSYGQ